MTGKQEHLDKDVRARDLFAATTLGIGAILLVVTIAAAVAFA